MDGISSICSKAGKPKWAVGGDNRWLWRVSPAIFTKTRVLLDPSVIIMQKNPAINDILNFTIPEKSNIYSHFLKFLKKFRADRVKTLHMSLFCKNPRGSKWKYTRLSLASG